jgi:hypothetical protein
MSSSRPTCTCSFIFIFHESVNLQKSGKSSSKDEALLFNPLVSKILIKRSALKRVSHAERKQRNLLQAVSRRIKKEKQRLLEERRRLIEDKRLIRDQANRANYHSYHRKCGHANLTNLVVFKGHGKVIVSRLPPKFLRNYRKECPLCVAMKKGRKSLPKGMSSTHEIKDLGRRPLLIVVASLDVKANRGTTSSQCLCVLRQATRLPFPISSAITFRWSISNSRKGSADIQRYYNQI